MTVLSASVSYQVDSRWSNVNPGRFHTNIDKKINELVMGGDIPWAYGATHLSFNFNVVFPDVYKPISPYMECPNSGPYIHWGAFNDERERGIS